MDKVYDVKSVVVPYSGRVCGHRDMLVGCMW